MKKGKIYLNDIDLNLFMKYFDEETLNYSENKPEEIDLKVKGCNFKFKNINVTYNSPIERESFQSYLFPNETLEEIIYDDDSFKQVFFMKLINLDKKFFSFKKFSFFQYNDKNLDIFDRNLNNDVEPYYNILINDGENINFDDSFENIIKNYKNEEILKNLKIEKILNSKSEYNEYNVFEKKAELDIFKGKIIEHKKAKIFELSLDGNPIFLDSNGNRIEKKINSNNFLNYKNSMRSVFSNIINDESKLAYKFVPGVVGLIDSVNGKKLVFVEIYKKKIIFSKYSSTSVPEGANETYGMINPKIREKILENSYTLPISTIRNIVECKNLDTLPIFYSDKIDIINNISYYSILGDIQSNIGDNIKIKIFENELLKKTMIGSIEEIKISTITNRKLIKLGKFNIEKLNVKTVTPYDFLKDSSFIENKEDNSCSKITYIHNTLEIGSIIKCEEKYTYNTYESGFVIPKNELLEYEHILKNSPTDRIFSFPRSEVGRIIYIERKLLNNTDEIPENSLIEYKKVTNALEEKEFLKLFSDNLQFISDELDNLKGKIIKEDTLFEKEKEAYTKILSSYIDSEVLNTTSLGDSDETSLIKKNIIVKGKIKLYSNLLKEEILKEKAIVFSKDNDFNFKMLLIKKENEKEIPVIDYNLELQNNMDFLKFNSYQKILKNKNFPLNEILLKEIERENKRKKDFSERDRKDSSKDELLYYKKKYLISKKYKIDFKDDLISSLTNFFYEYDQEEKSSLIFNSYKKIFQPLIKKASESDNLKLETDILSKKIFNSKYDSYEDFLNLISNGWRVQEWKN